MHPTILRDDPDQGYSIRLVPCVITKRFDKCICVKLGEIEPQDEQGKPIGKMIEVIGQFSAAGLSSLFERLQEAPPPIALPTSEEVRHDNPYQWAVQYEDGRYVTQYREDGSETPFREVALGQVIEFWVVPRPGHDLPRYGLMKTLGFVRIDREGFQTLDFPWPDVPFHWEYYRRVTMTFGSFGGQPDQLPAHVRQCFGWWLTDGDGTEIRLELAIEADGSWTVHKKEPLDHSAFQK